MTIRLLEVSSLPLSNKRKYSGTAPCSKTARYGAETKYVFRMLHLIVCLFVVVLIVIVVVVVVVVRSYHNHNYHNYHYNL